MIALGAVKCADIEAGRPSSTRSNASSRCILDNAVAGWARSETRDEENMSLPSTVHLCASTHPRDRRGKAVCHSELRTRPMSWIAVSRSLSVRRWAFSVSAISSRQRQSQVVRLFWWLRIASIRPATLSLAPDGCVPAFIGAAVTCASLRPHLMHRRVKCFEPNTGRRNVSHLCTRLAFGTTRPRHRAR